MNARPEPVFRYFSKANALYLSMKPKAAIQATGNLSRVQCTWPFELRRKRLSKLFVQPT